MKFVLKPSLEHIALVEIVVILWNQNDVRTLMANLRSPVYIGDEEWQRIEDRVIEKVPHLLLPGLLKEKLLGFIKPIGLQISEWIQHVYKGFRLHFELSAELCWTLQGTIDRKKAAEVLCKDENLDILKRFRLAYIYCLEDNITELWKKMPGDLRQYISDGGSPSCTYEPILVSLWTHTVEQEERCNESFSFQPEFESSARDGNKAATEYFLQKLTPRERQISLLRTVKSVSDTDVLCFLLLQMDETQQIDAFKCSPYKILQCFLDWPYQIFFIETANLIWEFLLGWHYVALLERIVRKLNSGWKDWNYKKLFEGVLQKSPNTHFITNKFVNERLLSLLFQIKDKEIASLFLKNASPAVKNKLMCNNSVPNLYKFFQWVDKWNLLETFIREFLPSKEEMTKFKEKLETNRMSNYYETYLLEIKPKLDNLFHLYDDSICE